MEEGAVVVDLAWWREGGEREEGVEEGAVVVDLAWWQDRARR